MTFFKSILSLLKKKDNSLTEEKPLVRNYRLRNSENQNTNRINTYDFDNNLIRHRKEFTNFCKNMNINGFD